MACLVVLDADLEVVQQVLPCSAAPRRWTRVPSARRPRREVLPSTATACCGLRAAGQHLWLLSHAPGTVATHARRGRPAAGPTAVQAAAEQGPRVKTLQVNPDRRHRVPGTGQ
jgi:hypothetical protein